MYLQFLENLEHKEAFLELAHRVIESDGFVNRNEWNYLRSWKLELGMESWEPDPAKEGLPLAKLIGCVKEEQVRNLFLAELLLVIYADGNCSPEETRFVEELQSLFGYSDSACDAFRDWVKRMGQLRVEGMKLILGASPRK